MEDPTQVDIDDLIELLDRHVHESGILGDAGIVDQHIDTAMARKAASDDILDCATIRDVQRLAMRMRAHRLEVLQTVVEAAGATIAGDDDGAFLSEFPSCGQPDALGGSGDEANFAK